MPRCSRTSDQAGVGAEVGAGVPFGEAERQRLLVVVAQDRVGDVVGHAGEQRVARGDRRAGPTATAGAERDLDVDLLVGGVDAGRVVDEVGVEADAARRTVSMRARCVMPRLAPSPITLARSCGAVMRIGIVGAVAGIGVGLGRGADVGADAAEPQEIGVRLQDRVDQLGGRHGLLVGAEQRAHLGRQRHRLRRARENAAALRDQRLVVVLPARPRQREQPRALGEARRRIGIGIEEDVAMVEGGDEPGLPATAACRCRTRRRTCRRRRSRVNGCVWMSTSISRKWRFTHSQAPRAVMPIFLWS